jgi:centrin-1
MLSICLTQIKEALLIPNVDTYAIILELKAAMISLGFDSKNATIFQMVSDLDEDGSGEI